MARIGFWPPQDGHLRCSDAEREQVAGFLRDQAVEGRLTPDELADRVASAYRAVTIGDLERLVDDLPRTPSLPGQPWRPPGRRAPAVAGIAGVALVAALLPGPVWILAVVGLALGLTLTVTVVALGVALAPFLLAGVAALYVLRRMGGRGQLRPPRG
jgi:hypothetical protein